MKKILIISVILIVGCEFKEKVVQDSDLEVVQYQEQVDEELTAEEKAQGVIGSTCWSDPQVFATVNGQRRKIFCFTVPKFFYPGISAFMGKDAHINKCRRANALDPSGNYPDASSTCYARCSFDTHCIHGDNR